MTEQKRFMAAEWLPTDNGQTITCYGNCVEIGLGLKLQDVKNLFFGLMSYGEGLGVLLWLESDDGVLRVFLRVVDGMGLREFDHTRAACLWVLAIGAVRTAIAWNESHTLAGKVCDDETQLFANCENLRFAQLLEIIGGEL